MLLIISIIGIAAYPFLIYFGISFNLLHFLLPTLAVIFILRILSLKNAKGIKTVLASISALCAVIVCIAAFMAQSQRIAMYYPVCVNLVLFFVFGGSLFTSKSIVTRLALIKDKELSDNAVNYTRIVTKIWVIFFMANGSMAFITAQFCSVETWTLYNGFIAYILIGILAMCEYIARIIFRHINERK